jgi:hypothetical protein
MMKRLKRRGPPRPRLIGKDEAESFLARINGVMSEEDVAFLRSVLDAHQSIRDVLTSSLPDDEGLARIKAAISRTRLS